MQDLIESLLDVGSAHTPLGAIEIDPGFPRNDIALHRQGNDSAVTLSDISRP